MCSLDLSGSPTEPVVPVVQPMGRRLQIPDRHQPTWPEYNHLFGGRYANKEDRVAKLEWAPGGGLGRVL
jgi:hypothetical protein